MPRPRLAVGIAALAAIALAATATATAGAAATSAPSTAYRANDYADGRAMSILPPGENGLVNATDALKFELTQTRPPASDDQLGKYSSLIYSSQNLADAGLSAYYNDESFGVAPGDVTRTEQPESGVTIYRDTHDVPHIYGNTNESMAFGAGYAQAEDRLFLMDVLRHYGSGIAGRVPRLLLRVRADGPRPAAAVRLHAGTGPGSGRRAAHGVRRARGDGEVAHRELRRRRQRLRRRRRAPTRRCCPPTTPRP